MQLFGSIFSYFAANRACIFSQQINVEMDTDGYCISVVQTGFGFVCVCVCLSVQHHAWHQMCVVIL